MSELTPYLCVADARAAIEWYVDGLVAVLRDPFGHRWFLNQPLR